MDDTLTHTLFTRFSTGRTPGKGDFNASKMFSLLEDPFGIWCFFHAPQEEAVVEINRYENLKVRTDRNALLSIPLCMKWQGLGAAIGTAV